MINLHPRFKVKWLLAFLLLTACVDRIYFDIPSVEFQTVVDGLISDGPGPYTVKISKGLNLDADSSFITPVEKAKIKLFDDLGNVEDFTETGGGVYVTHGAIQGQIGHSYHISILTPDGKSFESLPDQLNPVGDLNQISYEYEARTIQQNYGPVQADVFNVYVDATAIPGDDNYVRWRFTGTYEVQTNPELRIIWSEGYTLKDPLSCSGYEVAPALGGGLLVQVAPCTCCTCWVNLYESIPHLSDGQLISNNQFKNVKVAEVPISPRTFVDKYLVEVEQMSLSRNAFDFFKLIRAQKEGASSLFQPPSGEIKGNVIPVNPADQVIGLFWATSIKVKTQFIPRSAVPYILPAPDLITEACTGFDNSSTSKPKLWE